MNVFEWRFLSYSEVLLALHQSSGQRVMFFYTIVHHNHTTRSHEKYVSRPVLSNAQAAGWEKSQKFKKEMVGVAVQTKSHISIVLFSRKVRNRA